ncbi:TPA: hypothetical protein ACW72O_003080, partial [Elizabethkingia anophelis]
IRKILSLKGALYLLVFICFYSCRTENNIIPNNSSQNEVLSSNELRVNSKLNQPTIDEIYTNKFASAYHNYLITNKSENKLVNGDIDFNYYSQLIVQENKRGMIFPVIYQGKVEKLVIGLLQNNDSEVQFFELKGQEYESVKRAFSSVYNQLSIIYSKESFLSKLVACDGPPMGGGGKPPCTTIPPVVITVPKPVNPFPPIIPVIPTIPVGPRPGIPTNPVVVSPKDPIKDIKEFLKCLDPNKSASLSIFSEKTNLGDRNVGHAFISISQGENTMTFGFYPEKGFPQNIAGPGIFNNDSEHFFSIGRNMGTISGSQLQGIISLTELYSKYQYSLAGYNCANFVMEVLQKAGYSADSGTFTGPNAVYDFINKFTNSNQPSGKGPATKRNCK